MVRMLRRALRLGLLASAGVGILKAVKDHRADEPWADSWASTGAPTTRSASVPASVPATPAAPKAETPASPDQTAAPAGTPAKSEPGQSDRAGSKAPSPSSRAARPATRGPARKSPTGKAENPPGERLWVAANQGVCPSSHPVKAKLASSIFHTPASRNYSRTKADRCYPDEASAEADGLRPAQR